jgi:hypothetical protein
LRGVTPGDALEIRPQQLQQLTLAAADIQVAQYARVDIPSSEIRADQVTLASVEELGSGAREPVAYRVGQ